jgi:CubicO group peptidase (beta-lactamase class C family)
MNNNLTIIAIFALAVLNGCSKEAIPTGEQQLLTKIKVNVSQTKVSFDSEGKSCWDVGDEISVICNGKMAKFSTDAPGISTTFSGEIAYSEGSKLWGVYPYHNTASAVHFGVTTILPSVQTAAAGSYSNNIRIASYANEEMTFRNACGALKFKLSTSGIKKVILLSPREYSAGKATFEWRESSPVLSSISAGENVVSLVPAEGEFQVNKYYYISVLPGQSDNYVLSLEKDNESAVYEIGEYSFKRNTNKVVNNLDAAASWTGKILTFDFAQDENFNLCPIAVAENQTFAVTSTVDQKYDFIYNNCYNTSGTYGGGSSVNVKYLVIGKEGYLGLPVIDGYKLTGVRMALGNVKAKRYVSVNSDEYARPIITNRSTQTILPLGETSVSFDLANTVPDQRYWLYSQYTHVIGTLKLIYEPAQVNLWDVDNVIERAIKDGTIPGAVLGIYKNGETKYLKAYGNKNADVPMTTDVVFDMMSVTKVMSTTVAIMQLYEQGKLSLNEKVSTYLSEFPSDDPLTVKQLLIHASGFPSRITSDYSSYDVQGYLNLAAGYERPYQPGTHYQYSCTNFFILQQIVERITGERLCDYATENIYIPLGMNDTRYLIIDEPIDASYKAKIAPTSSNLSAVGRVYDALAKIVCKGNAGNAGLFSSVEDCLTFGKMLLNGGILDGQRILNEATVQEMATVVCFGRTLGWDCLTSSGFEKGSFTSHNAIFHTGYCGTMIMLDFENDMCVVLNANRSYPSDTGYNAWMRYRGWVCDVIGASLL